MCGQGAPTPLHGIWAALPHSIVHALEDGAARVSGVADVARELGECAAELGKLLAQLLVSALEGREALVSGRARVAALDWLLGGYVRDALERVEERVLVRDEAVGDALAQLRRGVCCRLGRRARCNRLGCVAQPPGPVRTVTVWRGVDADNCGQLKEIGSSLCWTSPLANSGWKLPRALPRLMRNACGGLFSGAVGHVAPGTPMNSAPGDTVLRITVKSRALLTTIAYPKRWPANVLSTTVPPCTLVSVSSDHELGPTTMPTLRKPLGAIIWLSCTLVPV